MAQWGDVAIGPLDAEGRPWWELRCGRWEDALADVERVDALITDPPYSERTHNGKYQGRAADKSVRRALDYAAFSPEHVDAFVARWSDAAASGWLVCFTDSQLAAVYRAVAEERGRYAFAPLACVQIGMNVRLAGDGPSNWTTWLCVSRPRSLRAWGTLPGAYVGNPFDPGYAAGSRAGVVIGSKPLWLMRAIVRDYSRPGDLVCDPCAGGATTLIAAVTEGRRAIGAEMDPATFDLAVKRLRRGWTPDLFARAPQPAREAEQKGFFDDGSDEEG